MDIFTFFSVVCWTIAGFWLILGEHPRLQKYKIEIIFGISNRYGKIAIGVFLIAFCSFWVWQWYVDPNAPLALLWEPLKLSY